MRTRTLLSRFTPKNLGASSASESVSTLAFSSRNFTRIASSNSGIINIKDNVQPNPKFPNIRNPIHFQTQQSRSMAKIIMQVPSMGDSITEGTIVEFLPIGTAVKVDDVVAQIETDKVTVDIKAEVDGVLVERMAEVDGEVEVGGDLYVIDTEAEAVAASSVDEPVEGAADSGDNATAAAASEASESAASTAAASTSSSVRVPSIQFLGKDGWKKRLSVAGAATTPAPTKPLKPNGSILVEGGPLPATYGRLPLSEREMDDLLLGGASEAPYGY